MSFYGSYEHTIDTKNRFRIPADLLSLASSKEFIITRGLGGCLAIYIKQDFLDTNNKLKECIDFDPILNSASRNLNMDAKNLEVDNQGRFALNNKLKEKAHIEKDIIFIGNGKFIEMWASEKAPVDISEEEFINSNKLISEVLKRKSETNK